MLVDTFANRLNKIMSIRNIKPIELSNKTGIAKSQISHWLAGTYKAKQDSLTVLAEFFDVDETWLMGFDVPMKSQKKALSKEEEQELLKDFLTRKVFLDENEEMNEKDFNNLIEFAKANKNFIMRDKDKQ
ncbi:MAG: helix-turn-helix domain-containing protein [Mycoplasmatota bacterium]|nr:helix-turn-helix domain-containing protein [Mycoplasmatota bacterium]